MRRLCRFAICIACISVLAAGAWYVNSWRYQGRLQSALPPNVTLSSRARFPGQFYARIPDIALNPRLVKEVKDDSAFVAIIVTGKNSSLRSGSVVLSLENATPGKHLLTLKLEDGIARKPADKNTLVSANFHPYGTLTNPKALDPFNLTTASLNKEGNAKMSGEITITVMVGADGKAKVIGLVPSIVNVLDNSKTAAGGRITVVSDTLVQN